MRSAGQRGRSSSASSVRRCFSSRSSSSNWSRSGRWSIFTLFAQSTFLGSAFAMLGYAGGAQVMIFYLPLFLQNAFDLSPAMAGLAMLPFALPMFLTPRLGAGLARRYSGRTLLTVGLMTTLIGNLLLWALARSSLPYPAFLLGLPVAGAGPGLLNTQTPKA